MIDVTSIATARATVAAATSEPNDVRRGGAHAWPALLSSRGGPSYSVELGHRRLVSNSFTTPFGIGQGALSHKKNPFAGCYCKVKLCY
jgi:hypothetical protein